MLQILTVACLALAPSAMGSSDAFLDDFDEAVTLARKENKDLFVDFTGSDWCGWCIKLDEEVFSHEEFLVEARKDYVLVALDYPRSDEAKAAVPNPERNDELRDKYGVRGYPSCLLMTADGDVYGKTGYQAGGPEKYIEHLRSLRESGRKALEEVLELVKRFDAAKCKQRLAVWERARTEGETGGEPRTLLGLFVQAAKQRFEERGGRANGPGQGYGELGRRSAGRAVGIAEIERVQQQRDHPLRVRVPVRVTAQRPDQIRQDDRRSHVAPELIKTGPHREEHISRRPRVGVRGHQHARRQHEALYFQRIVEPVHVDATREMGPSDLLTVNTGEGVLGERASRNGAVRRLGYAPSNNGRHLLARHTDDHVVGWHVESSVQQLATNELPDENRSDRVKIRPQDARLDSCGNLFGETRRQIPCARQAPHETITAPGVHLLNRRTRDRASLLAGEGADSYLLLQAATILIELREALRSRPVPRFLKYPAEHLFNVGQRGDGVPVIFVEEQDDDPGELLRQPPVGRTRRREGSRDRLDDLDLTKRLERPVPFTYLPNPPHPVPSPGCPSVRTGTR
ncbi:MAG: thioredoxin family protein [Planctomycetes bacterium]|nr:thioredoxin family protein [Planctomycetota bacterium]